MPRSSLNNRLSEACSRKNPFEALYSIATELRDVGLPQASIYQIFDDHRRSVNDDTTFDVVTTILDCIWAGGWGNDLDLFPNTLSQEELNTVWAQLWEPSADDSTGWELEITAPPLYLRFQVEGPHIAQTLRMFLQDNMNCTVFAEQLLGHHDSSPVSIIKDSEFSDRFFLCIIGSDSAVRYTLTANDLGDYIRALMSLEAEFEQVT